MQKLGPDVSVVKSNVLLTVNMKNNSMNMAPNGRIPAINVLENGKDICSNYEDK